MKKFVLTGGPGVGKTTVVEILASRGFSIVPEAARMIIEEQRLKNSDILPSKNLALFQEYVLDRQLELEEQAQEEKVFLDRGVVDGYAFCTLGKVPVPARIAELAPGRYDKIFLLDHLPEYKTDGIRNENPEFSKNIHNHIIEAYKHFGYELITVPPLPPEERVNFILNQCD